MEGLDQRKIEQAVRRFYDRVRVDNELAPVFSVVEDWDEHLIRLSEFWSSIALMTGQYKGNPLAMHLIHLDLFKPEMFERWLALWRETTNELLCPQDASMLQTKAARIATRFRTTMFTESSSPAPPSRIQPFKTSSEFTHENMPAVLLRERRLVQETWVVIRVRKGEVRFFEGDAATGRLLGKGTATLVRPDTPHRLEIAGPVSLILEFYDQDPAWYFTETKGKFHV
jgi:hemoglobin